MVRRDRLQLTPRYDSGACASSGIVVKDGAFDLTQRQYDAPSPRPRGALRNINMGCVMGLPARYRVNGTGRDTYCVSYKPPHPGKYEYANDLRLYERSIPRVSPVEGYTMQHSPRTTLTRSRQSLERLSTPKAMFPSLTGRMIRSPRTSSEGESRPEALTTTWSTPDLSPRKHWNPQESGQLPTHASAPQGNPPLRAVRSFNRSGNWLVN